MFRFLLKKEVKDIIYSYKSVLFLVLCSIFPFLVSLKGIDDCPIWVEVLFVQMLVGQFIYDSYLLDVKNGGLFFLYNSKIKFMVYFAFKNVIGVFVALVPICLNLNYLISELSWINILWLLLTLPYCNSLMFIASVFSKGEEMITALFVSILFVFLLIIIYKLSIFSKFIVVIVLDFIFIYASYFLSKTIFFRKQIN